MGTNPADLAGERFFPTVDRVVLENYSGPSGLPLMLAALPEHRTPFRELSRNPLLLDGGIGTHSDGLPANDLRQRAWQVGKPHYTKRLEGFVEMFGAARSRGRPHVADIHAGRWIDRC